MANDLKGHLDSAQGPQRPSWKVWGATKSIPRGAWETLSLIPGAWALKALSNGLNSMVQTQSSTFQACALDCSVISKASETVLLEKQEEVLQPDLFT